MFAKLEILLLGVIVWVLASCSTTGTTRTSNNLFNSLYEEQVAYKKNSAWYDEVRSASIYKDFQLQLEVFGIFASKTFNQALASSQPEGYVYNSSLTAQGTENRPENLEFLLATFWPSRSSFGENDFLTSWQLSLWLDDQELTPISLVKLREKDYEYRYIANNFQHFNRWTVLFKVVFAKTPKLANRQLPTSMVVQINGLAGSLKLVWQDTAKLF